MAEAQKESERRAVTSFKKGTDADPASEQEQIVVTIHASTGRVVKAERIGKAGELFGDDKVKQVEAALVTSAHTASSQRPAKSINPEILPKPGR